MIRWVFIETLVSLHIGRSIGVTSIISKLVALKDEATSPMMSVCVARYRRLYPMMTLSGHLAGANGRICTIARTRE